MQPSFALPRLEPPKSRLNGLVPVKSRSLNVCILINLRSTRCRKKPYLTPLETREACTFFIHEFPDIPMLSWNSCCRYSGAFQIHHRLQYGLNQTAILKLTNRGNSTIDDFVLGPMFSASQERLESNPANQLCHS